MKKTNKDSTTNKNTANLEEIKKQLEEEKSRRLILMADFDNFKKRIEAEKSMFGAMANMGLIQEILEVCDDLQLALDDADLSIENAKTSLKNAQEKLSNSTKNAGVERVEVNKGDDFDKEKMEAIQTIPDEKNKDKVIAVISSAYKYTDRDGIIRPAKVIVGK